MIFSILLPETCRLCGVITRKKYLCSGCLPRIKFVREPWCPVCGSPFQGATPSHPCPQCLKDPPAFHWHRSSVEYHELVAPLFHRYKYRAGFDLVPLFLGWMGRYAEMIRGTDYLIPVPLSMKRLRERTYNQSLELARALSKVTGIPVLPHSLRKTKHTPPQTQLSREERKLNLKGAFTWVGREKIEGKKVVFIDDVFTTGSTLSECAFVLSEFKPKLVGALTCGITVS